MAKPGRQKPQQYLPKFVVWSVREDRDWVAILANQWDLNSLEDADDDDDGSGQNSPPDKGPKGLRNQLQSVLAQNKQMVDRLAEFEAAARRGAIAAVISEKKLNPKVAALVPKEVDPTPDAVGKWLEEYLEVFSPPQSDDGGNVDDDDSEDDGALQRIGRAQNASIPPTKAADLMSQINDPAMTSEKLVKLIESQGGGYGQG